MAEHLMYLCMRSSFMLLGQDWDFAHVDTQINFLNSKLVLAFMET